MTRRCLLGLLVMALPGLLGPASSPWADCLHYEEYMRWAGDADEESEAYGIAVSGGLLFVSDNNSGLQVYDLGDPRRPHWVGVAGISDPMGVAAVGALAFVADVSFGLRIVDARDPDAPVVIGSVETPGSVRAVAVEDGLALVADGDLQVIDVSDPADPVWVATLTVPDFARSVAVSDDLACVASSAEYGGWLTVVDISDPSEPLSLAQIPTAIQATCVSVAGDLACLGGGAPGAARARVWPEPAGGLRLLGELLLFDLADPAAPQPLGSVDLERSPNGVALDGERAFVADAGMGLVSVDLSDPAAPIVRGTLDAPGTAFAVALAGNLAYLAHDDGAMVCDIARIESPALLGSLGGHSWICDVALSGQAIYAAQSYSGLAVIDVSDATAPVLLAELALPSAAWGIAAADPYAFALTEGGLVVLDVEDPADPSVVAELALYLGSPFERLPVARSGDLLFLASGTGALHIVGVSSPESPELLSSVSLPQPIQGMSVDGDRAFLATGGAGLFIVDVSAPASPAILSCLDLSEWAADVAVDGHLAYVAGGQWLCVVDVEDPAAPALIECVPTPSCSAIEVSGSTAYLAGYTGLRVVDLSDPLAPAFVGGIDSAGETSALVVGDECVHLAARGFGLEIASLQCEASGAAEQRPAINARPALAPAWPSPARGEVLLRCAVPRSGSPRLAIHDTMGRLVRSLPWPQGGEGGEGGEVVWDGRDGAGQLSPAGCYLARLSWDDGQATRRIVIVR